MNEETIISPEMIDAWITYCKEKLGEEVEVDAAVGTLKMYENGQGELAADLMNGNELFYPLMQVYYNKGGHEGEMPESWKLPLETVEELVADPMAPLAEKLPEATQETM